MISKEDHDIMCDFCALIQKIGLAPYGVNVLLFKYIKEETPKDFIYRFWTEED